MNEQMVRVWSKIVFSILLLALLIFAASRWQDVSRADIALDCAYTLLCFCCGIAGGVAVMWRKDAT